MKINDPQLTAEAREQTRRYLLDHTETIRRLQNSAAERAEKLLVLVNGGGVVATLSFMGAMPAIRLQPAIWNVLGLYILGVIFCGVLSAINYHTTTNLLNLWIERTDSFMKAEISFEQVTQSLRDSIGRSRYLAPASGYLAGACFIAASAVALCQLHP